MNNHNESERFDFSFGCWMMTRRKNIQLDAIAICRTANDQIRKKNEEFKIWHDDKQNGMKENKCFQKIVSETNDSTQRVAFHILYCYYVFNALET